MLQVREAIDDDVDGILDIYNDVIATSSAVYTETPTTCEERLAWLGGRRAQGYPVLVALDETGVAGFASFGDFRAWPGYRFTVEHSVHVRRDLRGCGIGRALMTQLIPMARTLGKHVLVAGVDAANDGSLRFHERLGFERVGHFREVGTKFDRWLDLVFLQLMLDDRSSPLAGA